MEGRDSCGETELQIKHLIPPAPSVALAGEWLKAVPGSTLSPPDLFCMAGKGPANVAVW